ncbi:MAG: oligopeptide:H+ symporter [Pseudomonadota bacterium]
MSNSSHQPTANSQRSVLGHPPGLFVLFFTEMWERFSYYGMRALLVLFLTKHFLFDRDAAFGLYGAYTTLVYITPVLGGYLADRYLGQRKAVLFGALLLVLGHAGMALEGDPVAPGGAPDPRVLNIFYFSLALIIAGVGFLKANISTIVGELYAKTDQRRDSAYTLFYVGINTGAALGALLAGYLGETYGWRYGFGAAGVGMLLGLLVFIWGKPLLHGAGEPPDPQRLCTPLIAGISTEWLIYLGTGVMTLVLWVLVRDQGTVNLVLTGFGAVVVGYILMFSVSRLVPEARNRIIAALILISLQILFWGLFEQTGSSLSLYIDDQVDRNLFGWIVPASMFQSLNASYIILLGPIFAWLWPFLDRRGWQLSTAFKFALGLAQVGLGFLILVWGATGAGSALTPVLFIFLLFLLHTTGELCLSPVGLSAMTRLSPPSLVGLIMGTWFLASGAGNAVAALIAQATAATDANGNSQVLEVYSNVGWLSIAVAVGLALVSPLLTRLMHLDTLKDGDSGLREDRQPIRATR